MVAASAVGWLHALWPRIGRSHSDHLILPALDTPIKDTTNMSKVDFSKCFVEVDVVEMSMSGKEQRHNQIRTVSQDFDSVNLAIYIYIVPRIT